MAAEPKTIVISDVHMITFPYPGTLKAMLDKIACDEEVTELVLLGDFFDLWLYPINVLPGTVGQIIKANGWITAALQNCVASKEDVYYITGNHDVAVMPNDLHPFDSGGKSIKLISPDCYRAKYQGRRHLEHGHAVDMFNAPDDSSDAIGGYPLGFFITRLIATAAERSAARQALKVLLQTHGDIHKAMKAEAIDVRLMGSFLVKSIIDLLEIHAGVHDSTPIRFLEPGLDKITVGEIKSHYGSLYGIWRDRYPNRKDFADTMLVGVDPDGLDWYADKLLNGSDPPKVVLMGHTHHFVSKGAYNNDGCWCISSALGHGDPAPHYVEIIGDSAKVISWP